MLPSEVVVVVECPNNQFHICWKNVRYTIALHDFKEEVILNTIFCVVRNYGKRVVNVHYFCV